MKGKLTETDNRTSGLRDSVIRKNCHALGEEPKTERLSADTGNRDIAIGFITGRRSFRHTLKTYLLRWKNTSGFIAEKTNIHLIVAYDLSYNNTQIDDYIRIKPELKRTLSSITFLGEEEITAMRDGIVRYGILTAEQAQRVIGTGYAGKRNAVLLQAIWQNMDCLIFLDDDEYPLAVSNNHDYAVWSGQNVFNEHIAALRDADVTNGFHCGYLSPIPCFRFDSEAERTAFRELIEAVSNDAVNWPRVSNLMKTRGVTYADTDVLLHHTVTTLCESSADGMPITGSNLGLNLTRPERTKPFFNPPKARGEDTFFGLMLHERSVKRIPVYTFHDGFMKYYDILNGVLPIHLSPVDEDSPKTRTRFYRACLGWVRYKPLYLYLTDPDGYGEKEKDTEQHLRKAAPALTQYFQTPSFNRLLPEFRRYARRVQQDAETFSAIQEDWAQLMKAVP
ncbi:MAG: hypothetical protein ACOYBC_09150 [Bilifractor sp.]